PAVGYGRPGALPPVNAAAHIIATWHAVVFVYDVTKLTSFNNLGGWLREMRSALSAAPRCPGCLLGTSGDETARVSTSGELYTIPVQFPLLSASPTSTACRYLRRSAKDDSRSDHVESIFLTLAHKLVTSRPLMTRSYSEVMNDSSVSLHKASQR
uniref:RAB3GAP2_N domain-containing protein n=1 Tax=Macrostomum lignano TaxID=282301 RepID=A0A1I8FEA7_9PLAT